MMDAAAKDARRKLEARVRELGATMRAGIEGRMYSVDVTAPEGTHFAGESLHEITASAYVGPWSYDELFTGILDRIVDGVEPCSSECDYWDDDSEGN